MTGVLILIAFAAFLVGFFVRDLYRIDRRLREIDLTRQAARGELPNLRDRQEW